MSLSITSNRPELQLHWEATFKDGSTITQFEEGQENLFQIVQQNMSQLSNFSLAHISKPLKVTVDLDSGFIYLNNIKQPLEDVLTTNKSHIRLIYFRRNRIRFTPTQVKKHDIIYFLGYQYLDKAGRNKQVILQIDQEGNILIGG